MQRSVVKGHLTRKKTVRIPIGWIRECKNEFGARLGWLSLSCVIAGHVLVQHSTSLSPIPTCHLYWQGLLHITPVVSPFQYPL